MQGVIEMYCKRIIFIRSWFTYKIRIFSKLKLNFQNQITVGLIKEHSKEANNFNYLFAIKVNRGVD